MKTIEVFSEKLQEGLLLLFLFNDKMDLFHLSELVASHDVIDELMQLPMTQNDHHAIWIEKDARPLLQSKFKWSEKVKAAEKLVSFFQDKSLQAETVGGLWLMAGKKDKACQAFMEAMEKYKQEQLFKPTIEAGEKILKINAISEKEELEVLKNLVECYECCGQLHDVIQARKKLLEKPEIQNDKATHAAILRALAIDYGKQGSWSHYKKHRKAAAYLFRETEKYEEAALEFLALTIRGIDEINIGLGLQMVEEALQDAEHAEKTELICKCKSNKAYLLAMHGQEKEAHALAEEALELALKNNLLEPAAYAYRKLAGTYEYASDYSQAKTVYNQAVNFCETEQLDDQTQLCFSCMAWILFRLGEWKKAAEVSLELIKDPTVNNSSKSTAHCIIAIIKSLRGEIRPAEKHAQQGIMLSQKEQFLLMYHMFHLPKAKIFELKGDQRGAKEWYTKIVDDWHITNEKHDVLLCLMDAAVFFLENKDQEAIKKCLEIFSLICKETGNNEALGCMAYGLGLNALLNNQPNIALEHLTVAHKYLLPLQIPYQVMLVDFEIGKCLLALEQVNEAKQKLQELLVRSKKFGLAPLSSKITNIINEITLGQSPNEALLTDRQLDVLKLLSKGLSNKEIAAELYLSTRTVDMHMRNMFDRLGCNSRWEAVEKGRRLRLI